MEKNKLNFANLMKLDHFVIAIIGASGSGKTTMLKKILSLEENGFTHVILFQGSTPGSDNLYTNFIWPSDIYYNDPQDKDRIKNINTKIIEYNNFTTKVNTDIEDHIKRSNETCSKIKTLFIFDDFGPETKQFTQLPNVTRHANSYCIFLIHNDTDLGLSLRKGITHYFISVNFRSHQILELYKDQKNEYLDLKNQFINNKSFKSFLILQKDMPGIMHYCLSEQELKDINNDEKTLFKKCSRQRRQIKRSIEELAKILQSENIV